MAIKRTTEVAFQEVKTYKYKRTSREADRQAYRQAGG